MSTVDFSANVGRLDQEAGSIVGQRYSINRAGPLDIREGVELGRVMHAESFYSDLDYDPEKLHKFFSSAVVDPAYLVLIGRDDQQVMQGFGIFYASQYWFGKDHIVSDLALFIHPDFRKTTMAIKMLRHLETWARAWGAKEVCLGSTTGVKTEAYGKLLEKLGFTSVGGIFKKGM